MYAAFHGFLHSSLEPRPGSESTKDFQPYCKLPTCDFIILQLRVFTVLFGDEAEFGVKLEHN